MSKKSRRSRRQDRRRTRRRQKSQRRRREDRGLPPVDGIPPLIISTMASTPDEALSTYLAAHVLVPEGHPSPSPASQAHVARALCTLDDPAAPTESVLWAIMVLGHTPEQSALEALERYAASDAEHAAVARHAIDECQQWLDGPQMVDFTAPPQPQPRGATTQPMLN